MEASGSMNQGLFLYFRTIADYFFQIRKQGYWKYQTPWIKQQISVIFQYAILHL